MVHCRHLSCKYVKRYGVFMYLYVYRYLFSLWHSFIMILRIWIAMCIVHYIYIVFMNTEYAKILINCKEMLMISHAFEWRNLRWLYIVEHIIFKTYIKYLTPPSLIIKLLDFLSRTPSDLVVGFTIVESFQKSNSHKWVRTISQNNPNYNT